MLVGLAIIIFFFLKSSRQSVFDTLIVFLSWAIALSALFDVLCLKKGEYPYWWRKKISTRQRIRERFMNIKKILDPWSVPHFLFGVVMAFGTIIFLWPAVPLFFVTFFLALVWEWLEARFHLREAPGNAWMDILLPLIAFTATFLFAAFIDINEERGRAFFTVVVLLYIFTNFFAWRARFERDRDFLE